MFGFDKTIIFGFERRVGKNQSFTINAGTAALPRFSNRSADSFQVTRDMKNAGFNLSADYRFYLGKLNKYDAPRGVYIGPYYSLNSWRRESQWKSVQTDELVNTKLNFNLHMVGMELGYQFIFYKRFALDLVLIGPGLGFYDIKTKTEGNLSEEQLAKLQEAIVEKIQQKIPGFNYVFDGEKLSSQGTLRTNSLGFRYLIHIGYAF